MLADSRLGLLPRTAILGAIWWASLRLAYLNGRGDINNSPSSISTIPSDSIDLNLNHHPFEEELYNNNVLPELQDDIITSSTTSDITTNSEVSALGITSICSQTNWESGRWMECADIEGGVGNVRNAVLHCVRYAIAVGSSLVLPSLSLDRGLDTLFDVDHFKSTLAQVCPKMIIVNRIEDIPNYQQAWFPNPFRPRDLHALATGRPTDENDMLNRHVDTLRQDFDSLMGSTGLLVTRLAWPTYFEYPVTTDPNSFTHSFGQIIKFQPEVLNLVDKILARVIEEAPLFFGVDLNIDETDGNTALITFDIVSALSIKKAEVAEIRHLYISSGKLDIVAAFSELASARGLIVLHKHILLDAISLTKLSAMTSEQQELVDYMVLLECTHFSGLGDSSFSQNIAIARHQRLSKSKGLLNTAGDEFNSLFGAIDYGFFPDTMWS